MMKSSRRSVLQAAGAGGLYAALVAAGMLKPGTAEASEFEAAFKSKGVKGGLEAFGAAGAEKSDKVQLIAPDIAENGAVVPMGIASDLPNTEMMALLIEKNPNSLAGAYEVLPGMLPEVTMRVKMGQSSDVVALVKADGKFYMASKEVKVTLGGCGG
ncbi:MAG: thiosulfate oxidation carrier protein SoxY [Burkholderiaceae bacterium]